MSLYTQSHSTWTPAMITRLNHLKAMGFDVYEITRVLQKEHNGPHDWAIVLEKMQDLYFTEVFKFTTREMEELKKLPDPRNEEEAEKRDERKKKRELEAEGGWTGPVVLGKRKRKPMPGVVRADMKVVASLSDSVWGRGATGGIGPESEEATNKRHEKRRGRGMDVRELID